MRSAAILFLAALIGIASARLISPVQENIITEFSNAKVGENKICFHCESEPETEWYSNGVFYQIYPKSCESLFELKESMKF